MYVTSNDINTRMHIFYHKKIKKLYNLQNPSGDQVHLHIFCLTNCFFKCIHGQIEINPDGKYDRLF